MLITVHLNLLPLSENPDSQNFDKNMGYEEYDNNRSTRIFESNK